MFEGRVRDSDQRAEMRLSSKKRLGNKRHRPVQSLASLVKVFILSEHWNDEI